MPQYLQPYRSLGVFPRPEGPNIAFRDFVVGGQEGARLEGWEGENEELRSLLLGVADPDVWQDLAQDRQRWRLLVAAAKVLSYRSKSK